MIYLDNNATTKVLPEVFEAMAPYLKDSYGNPSSLYAFGSKVKKEIQKAREKVASLVGARDESEIIFTSGGTESNNAAIFSAIDQFPEKTELVTSNVEHPSVSSVIDYCEAKGYRAYRAQVNPRGFITEDDLKPLISDKTAIVSVMHANNESGVIFPVEKLAALAKEKGILFHTDGIQTAGKLPLDLKSTAIDYFSLSGHKLHAPKGVGALYVNRKTPFSSFLKGGGQESSRRAGTENVASIIGLGKACEIAEKNIATQSQKLKELRDTFEAKICSQCPKAFVNGDQGERIANTSNMGFEGLEGERILLHLEDEGVLVSTGSACSSGLREPSKVLKAMGIPYERVLGAIRFSFSYETTSDEIDETVNKVTKVIQQLS